MNDDLPRWVDLHCHLDLYPDHVPLIAQCERERIATLAVTTTPKAWQRNCELAKGRFVKVGLGLHPQLVADRAHEIDLWKSLLPQARFVGEVGLDAGPRFYASFEAQKRVFKTVLESCADAGGKILSIHSVRCVSTVLSMLEAYLPSDRGKTVLHWFTGTRSEARRAHELGCYFSVNADMLRSERGRDIIAGLSLDRVLTETDGPFGAVDGRPARPSDVPSLVQGLARLRKVESETLGKTVLQNWAALIG